MMCSKEFSCQRSSLYPTSLCECLDFSLGVCSCPMSLSSLMISWLRSGSVAVRGLPRVAVRPVCPCSGARASHCGGSSWEVCGLRWLQHTGLVAAAPGLRGTGQELRCSGLVALQRVDSSRVRIEPIRVPCIGWRYR